MEAVVRLLSAPLGAQGRIPYMPGVELLPTSIVSKLLVLGRGSGSIVNRTALYPLDDMCQ